MSILMYSHKAFETRLVNIINLTFQNSRKAEKVQFLNYILILYVTFQTLYNNEKFYPFFVNQLGTYWGYALIWAISCIFKYPEDVQ